MYRRHTNSKLIVMKEEVHTHTSLGPGGRAMWGSLVSVRKQRGRGMALGFLWQGMEQEGTSPGKVRIRWFEEFR